MAKKYFGEETTSPRKSKRKYTKRAASTSPIANTRRKYTKRADTSGSVTITIPAQLAFQVGIALGQAGAQSTL